MNISLTINSHSSKVECLRLFLFCMQKYIGIEYFNNIYLFVDKSDYIPPVYVKTIYYNPKDSFKDQMVYCLSQVQDDILLYCNEDYLFYDYAKLELANKLLNTLNTTDLSFIKFVHSDSEKYQEYQPKLYLIDKNCNNNFSQTLSFWKTNDILNIHKKCPRSEIGYKGTLFGHLEIAAQPICRDLDIKGVCYYNNEPKRGIVHFDTEVFPHTASAILKNNVWNNEYYKELMEINKLYEDYK